MIYLPDIDNFITRMRGNMKKQIALHDEIETNLKNFLNKEKNKFPSKDTLRIDLHCHDKNSNIPDEQLGRMLGLPETWLEPESLINTLEEHKCTAFTITNHNNARSCFALREKGYDILIGCEFSVKVPDFSTGIHVLAYGFTENDEKKLNKLRDNLYDFLEYAHSQNIPTIWAHPLYHYKKSSIPSLDLFEKLAVIFKRFEVINGQRDSWQNMLIKNWLDSLSKEKINHFIKKHKIDWKKYTDDPYTKAYTGGSDEHMGIFAGLTGTCLHIPKLSERLKTEKASDLALEALRNCKTSAFGSHNNNEKMMVAFIDYFCQIGLNMKDPGLLHILLHKGDSSEKLLAFIISNGFAELRRHKMTMRFLKIFHEAFEGKAPSRFLSLFLKKPYKPILEEVRKIASARKRNPETRSDIYKKSIEGIYSKLQLLFLNRIIEKLHNLSADKSEKFNFKDIIDSIEIPSHVRDLSASGKKSKIDIGEFIDGLPFPALASGVITAASFTSARVMYNTRPLLEKFSSEMGIFRHPKRMLWLTDTLEDTNGVAMVLKSFLVEIQNKNLPIDICVVSSKLKDQKNLIVLKPLAEFTLPFYENQKIRIPDIIELQNLFLKNGYDRIISSTEGFMGFASIFLKKAYSVPAYFYVHTDWMTFAKKVLDFDKDKNAKLKRLLRFFYGQYDKLFVLNTDQKKWLTGPNIGFADDKVFLTAHWVEDAFHPKKSAKEKYFGFSQSEPVLLFTGRISKEKGVDEVPFIYSEAKKKIPGLKMVFAGIGPEEENLKSLIPDAVFLGWVDHEALPEIYSSADMLILPSRFDTFGCVVLEALSCGLPVASYKTKGPKEIILHGKCGYVENSRKELADRVIEFFSSREKQKKFKSEAIKRASYFSKKRILDEFLKAIDI